MDRHAKRMFQWHLFFILIFLAITVAMFLLTVRLFDIHVGIPIQRAVYNEFSSRPANQIRAIQQRKFLHHR